jgi:succinate-acetate transporter protein
LGKTNISIFGGISKFLNLSVFEQILTKFCNFGLFWAFSAAMAVADSMPSFERKKNVITFAKSVKIFHIMDCGKAL